MDIKDLKEIVNLPDRYNLKFIVAEVKHSNGEKKTVVRVGPLGLENHKEITGTLKEEVGSYDQVSVSCIGGGKISTDFDQKTIEIKGESAEFGKEPDRKQTIHILQVAFPDFKIIEE